MNLLHVAIPQITGLLGLIGLAATRSVESNHTRRGTDNVSWRTTTSTARTSLSTVTEREFSLNTATENSVSD